MSKQTSVHSLDIVSRIKTPVERAKEGGKGKAGRGEKEREKSSVGGSKVEEVNITFNCNDFGVEGKAGGGGKRWREEALKELKEMNSENFKRISVDSRTYH